MMPPKPQTDLQIQPDIYLAALVGVARIDGIRDVERDFITSQAALFGFAGQIDWSGELDLQRLREAASTATLRLVIRDMVILASIDGDYSGAERERIAAAAEALGLPDGFTPEMETWVARYLAVLADGKRILESK